MVLFMVILLVAVVVCVWLGVARALSASPGDRPELPPDQRPDLSAINVESTKQLAEDVRSRIEISSVSEGDRVWHQKFYTGTVLEVDDQHLLIDFDLTGLRKFSSSHVLLYPPPAEGVRPLRSSLNEFYHQQRRERLRANYEHDFPYDSPPETKGPVERLSRRSPTVSGGLPSLGKRR